MNSEESRSQQVAVAATQQEEPVFNLDAKEFIPSFGSPNSFQMLPCKIQQNFLHDQLVNQSNLLTAGNNQMVNEPWKNFPASFFSMTFIKEPFRDQNGIQTHFQLSQAQWSFIFQFYPEYSQDPYDLMMWLHDKASNSENQSDVPQIESSQIPQMSSLQQQSHDPMFEAWKEINVKMSQQDSEQLWGENYYGFNMDRQNDHRHSQQISGSSIEQEYIGQHMHILPDDEDEELEYYADLYAEDQDESSDEMDDDLYDIYELQFDLEGAESEQDAAEEDTAADSKTIQSESENGQANISQNYMDLEDRSEENDDQIMDNDCFNKLKIINWSESDEFDFDGLKDPEILDFFQGSSLAEQQEQAGYFPYEKQFE